MIENFFQLRKQINQKSNKLHLSINENFTYYEKEKKLFSQKSFDKFTHKTFFCFSLKFKIMLYFCFLFLGKQEITQFRSQRTSCHPSDRLKPELTSTSSGGVITLTPNIIANQPSNKRSKFTAKNDTDGTRDLDLGVRSFDAPFFWLLLLPFS